MPFRRIIMLDVSQKIHSEIICRLDWMVFWLQNKSSICGLQSFNDDDLTGKSFVFKINLLMDSGRIDEAFFAHTKIWNKLGNCRKSNSSYFCHSEFQLDGAFQPN